MGRRCSAMTLPRRPSLQDSPPTRRRGPRARPFAQVCPERDQQVATPLRSHYAARSCSARLIHLAISVAVAPIVSNDRIIRSSDTDRSAASILATRDWLDPNRSASAACVKFAQRGRAMAHRQPRHPPNPRRTARDSLHRRRRRPRSSHQTPWLAQSSPRQAIDLRSAKTELTKQKNKISKNKPGDLFQNKRFASLRKLR